MDNLPGTNIGEIPISGFQWELDLYGIDGPLLSQYRSDTNEKYLLYWCDCNSNSNRWMILPVAENMRVRLIAQKISMREVVDAIAHNFVFFVDYDSEGNAADVHLVNGHAIPEDYLPEHESFITVDNPNEALGHKSVSFLFDDGWEIEPVRDFIRSYKQAYDFTYVILNGLLSRMSALPWQGGFSAMHFYGRIKAQVGENQARTELVQFASPGILKLHVDDQVADAVLNSVDRFRMNQKTISKAYNELSKCITRNSLNQIDADEAKRLFDENDELIGMLEDLAAVLGYEQHLEMMRDGRSGFEVAKILMAQFVRLRFVFQSYDGGKVSNARWEVKVKHSALRPNEAHRADS